MKWTIFALLLLTMVSVVSAEPVKITAPGEAYGHHGNCGGWNGCGSAETCALWACQINGFDTLVSYGDAKPCTEFGVCNLFNSQESVQCEWGNWCQVMGVTDIWCEDGSWGGMCQSELPPQDGEPEIPEFTSIFAGIALVGAVAGFLVLRKKN